MQTKLKSGLEEIKAYYSMSKSRCHPTSVKFLTDTKKVFDLDKISNELSMTLEYVKSVGEAKGVILFLNSRKESMKLIQDCAEKLSMPYVVNRWIGGTISNFQRISTRISKMKEFQSEKDSGKWNTKFSKKEIVLLDRELDRLKLKFGGIEDLDQLPKTIFILDPSKESIAVKEASANGIKIIGFANSNSDLSKIDYPILANISSVKVVEHVLNLVCDAYNNTLK